METSGYTCCYESSDVIATKIYLWFSQNNDSGGTDYPTDYKSG